MDQKHASGKPPWHSRKKAVLVITKQTCWNVPDSFHQATIRDARILDVEVNGKPQSALRMIFEITSLVHPTRKYVAKRIYKSSDSNALVADLEHLLGDEHTKVINLAGEIISEALSLIHI